MMAVDVSWKYLLGLFFCHLTFTVGELPPKIRCIDEKCKELISQALVKEAFDSQDEHLLTVKKNDLLQILGKSEDGNLWLAKKFLTGEIGFASSGQLKVLHVFDHNPQRIVELETAYPKIKEVQVKPAAEQSNQQTPGNPSSDKPHDEPDVKVEDGPKVGGDPLTESKPAQLPAVPPVPTVGVEVPNPIHVQARREGEPGNIEKHSDGGGGTDNDNPNTENVDMGRDTLQAQDANPGLEVANVRTVDAQNGDGDANGMGNIKEPVDASLKNPDGNVGEIHDGRGSNTTAQTTNSATPGIPDISPESGSHDIVYVEKHNGVGIANNLSPGEADEPVGTEPENLPDGNHEGAPGMQIPDDQPDAVEETESPLSAVGEQTTGGGGSGNGNTHAQTINSDTPAVPDTTPASEVHNHVDKPHVDGIPDSLEPVEGDALAGRADSEDPPDGNQESVPGIKIPDDQPHVAGETEALSVDVGDDGSEESVEEQRTDEPEENTGGEPDDSHDDDDDALDVDEYELDDDDVDHEDDAATADDVDDSESTHEEDIAGSLDTEDDNEHDAADLDSEEDVEEDKEDVEKDIESENATISEDDQGHQDPIEEMEPENIEKTVEGNDETIQEDSTMKGENHNPQRVTTIQEPSQEIQQGDSGDHGVQSGGNGTADPSSMPLVANDNSPNSQISVQDVDSIEHSENGKADESPMEVEIDEDDIDNSSPTPDQGILQDEGKIEEKDGIVDEKNKEVQIEGNNLETNPQDVRRTTDQKEALTGGNVLSTVDEDQSTRGEGDNTRNTPTEQTHQKAQPEELNGTENHEGPGSPGEKILPVSDQADADSHGAIGEELVLDITEEKMAISDDVIPANKPSGETDSIPSETVTPSGQKWEEVHVEEGNGQKEVEEFVKGGSGIPNIAAEAPNSQGTVWKETVEDIQGDKNEPKEQPISESPEAPGENSKLLNENSAKASPTGGPLSEEIANPDVQEDNGHDPGIEMISDDEDADLGVIEAREDNQKQPIEKDKPEQLKPEDIAPTPQFEVIDGTTIFLEEGNDFSFEDQGDIRFDSDDLQPSHKGPADHKVMATPPLDDGIAKSPEIMEGTDRQGGQENPKAHTVLETLDDFGTMGNHGTHNVPEQHDTKDKQETQGDPEENGNSVTPEDTFLSTADELARANVKFTKWLSGKGNLDIVLDLVADENPAIAGDQKELHKELGRMMNKVEWQKPMLKKLWHLFGDDPAADKMFDASPPEKSRQEEKINGDGGSDHKVENIAVDGGVLNDGAGEFPGGDAGNSDYFLDGVDTAVLADPYDFKKEDGDMEADVANQEGSNAATDHLSAEVEGYTTTEPPAYQTDYPPPLVQENTQAPPPQDFAPPTEAQQDDQHPNKDYEPPADAQEEEEAPNKTYSLEEIMDLLMENMDALFNVTVETMLPLLEMLPDEMKAVLNEPTFFGIAWTTVIGAEATVTALFTLLFCFCLCRSRRSRSYQEELELEVRMLTGQKEKALDGLKTTTKHFHDQNLEYHQYQQDMKDVDEKSKELIEMYEALKQEKEEMGEQMAEYERVNRKQQKELDGFRHKVSHQGDAHNKAKEQIQTLQQQTEELKVEVATHRDDALRLAQEVQGKNEETIELQKTSDELAKENKEKTYVLEDLTAEVALLKSNNESLTSTVADKNNEIEVLKDCLIQLKGIEDYGEGTEVDNEARILQLLDVNRANAKINLLEEERKKLEEKMEADSMRMHELNDNSKTLRKEVEAMQQECKTSKEDHDEARTKLEVLTEYFKNKEVEMQRKLGREEALKFHSQKELDSLGEKSAAAEAELSNYQQQIKDLKDEIEKSERSFRQQVAAHEKKAHESWLASRTAERKLRETNKEVASLRQRLTELQGRKTSDNAPIMRPSPGRMGSPSSASEVAMSTRDQPSRNSILEDAPSPPMIGGQRQSPSNSRDRPPSRPQRVSRQGRPPSFHEDYFPPGDMMPPPDMPFPGGPPGPFPPGIDPYGPPPMGGPFPPGMDFDGPPPPGYGPPGLYDFDPHGPPPPFMGPHLDDFGPEGPFPGMDPSMGPPLFRGPPQDWDDGRLPPPGMRGPPPVGGEQSHMRRHTTIVPPHSHLEPNQGPRTSSPLDPDAAEADSQVIKVYSSGEEGEGGELCRVCGEQASGCDYTVPTCHACRDFYYRNADLCVMCICSGKNSRSCKACRLKKCLEAGMEEMVTEVRSSGEEDEMCRVCGGQARGCHYGVRTCHPCREFFCRNVNLALICSCGESERPCKACRLTKCLQAGMKKTYPASRQNIRKTSLQP